MTETHLFSPFRLRDVVLRNRIAVSPMCQYSSEDGFATDWHLVHLGMRAIGGAGLVITEAAAVEPRGRISDWDLGLWKDEHCEMLSRIARFLKDQGAAAGIQLAHAGRKASTMRPWDGGAAISPDQPHGWQVVAPSPVPFREGDPIPHELSTGKIADLVRAFRDAAGRALACGFQVIELHGAHGYLLHEFLSPLSNTRKDEYGGSLENRMRIVLETAAAVREVWPERLPLLLRISATDWAPGGWNLDESVELAKRAKLLGVDLIDCSSGGLVPHAKIEIGPGYQVPFAERIRREADLCAGAVGMITEPEQADLIIREGKADLILLARQMLREPFFAVHAAHELGCEVPYPVQYERAFPKRLRQ